MHRQSNIVFYDMACIPVQYHKSSSDMQPLVLRGYCGKRYALGKSDNELQGIPGCN